MLTRLVILASCFFIFQACDTAEFEAVENGKKSTNSGETDQHDGDSDSADEPVMVGGAYLTCELARPQNSELSGGINIGCALRKKRSHRKVDLAAYDARWIVRNKNNRDENVRQTEARQQEYHRILHYLDHRFKEHILVLELVDDQNRTYSYFSDLSQIDVEVSQAKKKSASVPNQFKASLQGNPNTFGCSSVEDVNGIMSCVSGALSYFSGVCQNGKIASNYLDVASNPQGSNYILPNQPIVFEKNRWPCIVNENGVEITEVGGCFIVPVLGFQEQTQTYDLTYSVLEDLPGRVSWNDLQAMSSDANYGCVVEN